MKKLILLTVAITLIFASCTTKTTTPAPKKTVNVDNLEFYAPGKDTTVSWKSFEKKFHKGHLETCPGEFRPVKWISYDSTNHSVTLRLQGERITADSLKKILNPNEVPVVTTPPPGSDDSVSGDEGGSLSSGSSNKGFLGMPDWFWLILLILLFLALLWALLRRRNADSTHHTHSGDLNVVVPGLIAHTKSQNRLAQSNEKANNLQQQMFDEEKKRRDEIGKMQANQQSQKPTSDAGQRIVVKIEGSGNNVINIDYKKSSQQSGGDLKQDIDIHISKEATGANQITVKND